MKVSLLLIMPIRKFESKIRRYYAYPLIQKQV